MKIDRLIGILSILLQKDRVTASELLKRISNKHPKSNLL